MISTALFLLLASSPSPDPTWIKSRPITWNDERERLTREYRAAHYGEKDATSTIDPTVIVLHHTAIDTLEGSFGAFNDVRLPAFRKTIGEASPLNVSVQFLVDRDGTVYRLMPDDRMGRHTIGLNAISIGIENVGGNKKALTPAQVEADARLIRFLKERHPKIDLLIGHHEYAAFRGTTLWKERDSGYLTHKIDPGEAFMDSVRKKVKDLGLRQFPDESQHFDFSAGSTELLDREALKELSLRELSIVRNGIFARHGRPLRNPWVAAHFRKEPWYRVNPRYTDDLLTPLDRQNVDMVLEVERGFTLSDLRIKRNAVFARHGRIFRSEDLATYFKEKPWYRPDPGYTDARLTDDDKLELELVQKRERELSAATGFVNWKPGVALSVEGMENLPVRELFTFYARMHRELKLEHGSDCGMLELLEEEEWIFCEEPKGTLKPRKALAAEDRKTLEGVERALAVSLVKDEHFNAARSCEDECWAQGSDCPACERCERISDEKKADACWTECEKTCLGGCIKECKRLESGRDRKKEREREIAEARKSPPGPDVLVEKSAWALTRGFAGA